MNRIRQEKRASRRYSVRWRLEGRGISFMGVAARQKEVLRGQIENLSRGGLCLLAEGPVKNSSVIHCEIFPDHVAAGIPTIMEVRWMQPSAESSRTRIGLRFLT